MDPVTAAASTAVPLDLLMMLQQFVNIKAVLLAVAGTQFLKYFLPSPVGETGPSIVPGSWTTRMMPFVPLFIAFVVTYLLENDSKFTAEDAVRGLMSGMLASYGYRTTKVVFFGA